MSAPNAFDRARLLRRAAPLVILAGALASACSRSKGLATTAKTESGSDLRWTARSIVLKLAPEARGATMKPWVEQALRRAVTIWNDALEDCGAPTLEVSDAPLGRAAIREDRVNEVLFHERRWCPPSAADFEDCYDRRLHASTRLRPHRQPGNPRDGEIKEADLEVNGVAHRFSPDGREPGTLSLRALFAHELGHVLGLDHPCTDVPAQQGVRCDDPRLASSLMHPDAAEKLAGKPLEPLPAEIEAICRSHARSR